MSKSAWSTKKSIYGGVLCKKIKYNTKKFAKHLEKNY